MGFTPSLFFLIMLFFIPNSKSAPTYLYSVCSNSAMFTPKSPYQSNLNRVFTSLSSNATNPAGFSTASFPANTTTEEAIYGLFLCRGDQNSSACHDCVTRATSELPNKYCPDRKVAVIWYDECMIRYSNESFFGVMDQTPAVSLMNTQNFNGNQSQFSDLLGNMMNDVAKNASNNDGSGKKFATDVKGFNSLVTIYTLGQCTPDLSPDDCNRCLTIAIGRLAIKQGARILQPSCNIRYETYPFFNGADKLSSTPPLSSPPPPLPATNPPGRTPTDTITMTCPQNISDEACSNCTKEALAERKQSQKAIVTLPNCQVTGPAVIPPKAAAIDFSGSSAPPPKGHVTKRKHAPLLIAIFAGATISLAAIGLWIHLHRKEVVVETPNGDIDYMRSMESLQFDLSTIRAATRNFSIHNKLGQGGFGQVYKGVLEGGQEIAIKRLSKTSAQGVVQFNAEVLLVAKLQHKNLVKLLGFCSTSKEKILVYEYLRNSSLDQLLWNSTKKSILDWQIRFKVIVGIARGLLYLHEDSRLKIVHMDLKPSNILLNDDMNPKISDFGLAKLFDMDETEGDTKRIVGTYGYMAPEYAMTGHFSVKSDVYSFGIIILEIVSGQKNKVFGRIQPEETLLHRAWRLWRERNILDLVDATLYGKYPIEEVTKCIHLGLLCIHENTIERPRMATVVAALNGQSVSLPMPKVPNFFGDSSASTEMACAQYKPKMCASEIEYRPVRDHQGMSFTDSNAESITDLDPR